ncbi:NACHT domain-containing protein [Rhodopirellula bahusiensis]|uniref:NACHT domain-containing protein n=3 Tax=Rhodopirellula bahusiensis TaxID=2014065 RepID=UPI003D65AEA2
MIDWLVVWGVGHFIFRPILEELARDLAKDASKSYVGKCFASVFSVINQKPLSKATGLALKELLELIQAELNRADIEDDELVAWLEDVRQFTRQDAVTEAISSHFLETDCYLDPQVFAEAWQQLPDAHALPQGFSWQFIAKQFTKKIAEIRQSSVELQETFESLLKARDSKNLTEIAGLPPEFDLETYREALLERYGNLDFASLDATGAYYNEIRLWRVFVPQSVRECHEYDPQLLEVPKEHLERLVDLGELDTEQLKESEKLQHERRQAYVSQAPKPVLNVTDDPKVELQVILGDPGSGKSSLLRFLALRWARIEDVNLRYTQPLPLLIELREYNRWTCSGGKCFEKYLHEASTWHRLNQHTLKHLLAQPDRVVLLLDGLDEVFDPAERELVVNDIQRFSNDYKQVQITLTSRVVGYKPQRLRDADFRHFMLQDLDKDQIEDFLQLWHEITFDKPEEAEPKRKRLAKAIENSPSIAQLAGNPLLLTMMAILNRNQKLPDDRVDLYAQCSRLLLYQWDVERTLGQFPGLSDEIGLREKTDILRSVGYAMQTRLSDKSRANYIDGTRLADLIEDYLRTELSFEQSRAVARAIVEQLRTRNFILCDLGADSYAFVHRTFLEYFCAAEIVHRFNVAKTLSEQELIDLFDVHCRDDDWREVLLLICGQIDEHFIGRIIERLATRTNYDNWDGVTPIPELPLAVWCLSESRNIRKMGDSEQKLLDAVLTVFCKDLFGDCATNVLPAAMNIGTRWPSAPRVASIAHSMINNLGRRGRHYWPQFVAALCPNRDLILLLAGHLDYAIRHGAISALAIHWPDDATRKLLMQRAVQDDQELARCGAIEALAEKWPDETTRELLEQRAVQDDHEHPRRVAIEALAEKWPDETTRELLTQRAVQDDHEDPRRAAIEALAEKWPDETTCELLTQRAVDSSLTDEQRHEHSAALGRLRSDFDRIVLT